jgi:hypothetical protein
MLASLLQRSCPARVVRVAEGMETMQIARNTTLLDLVMTVSRQIQSESELIATVAGMVNRGDVQLCGTFKGETFDMTTLSE